MSHQRCITHDVLGCGDCPGDFAGVGGGDVSRGSSANGTAYAYAGVEFTARDGWTAEMFELVVEELSPFSPSRRAEIGLLHASLEALSELFDMTLGSVEHVWELLSTDDDGLPEYKARAIILGLASDGDGERWAVRRTGMRLSQITREKIERRSRP